MEITIFRKFTATNLIYSAKYGIIRIGGYHQSAISHLQFNNDDIKWKEIMKMGRSRGLSSAVMINENKIFCCGGYVGAYKNFTEIFDLENKKEIKLKQMTHKRCRVGIYKDEHEENKIYIGGGKIAYSKGSNKFEYYDLNKNNWFNLGDTNGTHGCNPIIWKDDPNIINIASVWSKQFEKMDLRENKWNIFIKDHGDRSFDDVFGVVLPKNLSKMRLCL